MDLPSTAHFIYIPGVVILGLVLGFVWGARLTREAVRLEAKRLEERQEARARKQAQRQQDRQAQQDREAQQAAGAGPPANLEKLDKVAAVDKPPDPPRRR